MYSGKKILILITLLIVVCGLAVVGFFGNDKSDVFEDSISKSLSAEELSVEAFSDLAKSSLSKEEPQNLSDPSGADNKGKPTDVEFEKELAKHISGKVQLDQTVALFTQTAKIDINLPREYKFQSVDLDDEILLIQGVDPQEKAQISILASEKIFTPDMLENIISQNTESFKNAEIIKSSDVKKIENLKTLEQSGLSNIKRLSVESNNKEVHIFIAERTDKKGSYVGIVSGDADYLEINEDRFDAIAKSLKTQP